MFLFVHLSKGCSPVFIFKNNIVFSWSALQFPAFFSRHSFIFFSQPLLGSESAQRAILGNFFNYCSKLWGPLGLLGLSLEGHHSKVQKSDIMGWTVVIALCLMNLVFQPLFPNKSVLVSATLVRHPVSVCGGIGVCCPSLRPGGDMKDDVEMPHIFSQWAHPNTEPGLIHRAPSPGEDGQWSKGGGRTWRRAWTVCTCHVPQRAGIGIKGTDVFDVFTPSPLVQLLFGSAQEIRQITTVVGGLLWEMNHFLFTVMHNHALVQAFHGGDTSKASFEQGETLSRTQLLAGEKIKACKFHTFSWTCSTFFHHSWTANLLVVQTPIIGTPTSWPGRRSSVYLLIISVWWETNPQQCALPRQGGLPAKAKHSLMKALLSQRSEKPTHGFNHAVTQRPAAHYFLIST